MTLVNLPPEQRGTPEQEIASPRMRVFPLGFTPRVKEYLRHVGVLPTQEVGVGDDLGILGFLADEEIAVVLAKVSRSAGGFLEIARTVDEEGAAKFHQKWVVSVEGYGHASVAEHAVIHMAVENTSSLAGDELTNNRLASFTEFSARFKGRQDVGYFTPDSVVMDPYLSQRWHQVHGELFGLNDALMARGITYIQTEEARLKHPQRRADGAKGVKTTADQFKNLMPASRLTSIGVTMNAREAEHAITKALSSPHPEVQGLGALLKEQCLTVAPTLVKYAERNPYLVLTNEGITFLVAHQPEKGKYPEIVEEEGQLVRLVHYDPSAEERFIAAALYSRSPGKTYQDLLAEVEQMGFEQKTGIFEMLLGNLGKHDAPMRMLEFAGDLVLEVPGMTYGDWREWKRHRMETYNAKELSVDYGYMTPPLAIEMEASEDSQFHGGVDAIAGVMERVVELYHHLENVDPLAAQYCVTRLHYRPAIIKMNLREAFQLVSLRSGPTAHPFIRRLAWATHDVMKKVHPLLTEHLGKRLFADGRPPRDFQWTY